MHICAIRPYIPQISKLEHDKLIFSKVPTLRFREFIESWTLIPIKKLLRFQNGINADSTKYGKGIKYISVSDILNNQYITYDCNKGLIDIDEKTLNRFIVEYGDILFQRSSETFEDIGRANVYLDKEHSATFGGFVIRGKKISDYNPLFFRYLLCTHNARKQTVRMGAGAQHYNIGQEGLEKICLYFPCLQEQQKISDLLFAIDNKIAVQNKIIKHRKSLIFSLVIEILLSFLSLIESALSLNVFSFFNNLLKFMWTIFKEVKRLWSRKKT